jgi:AraC-like DNA-binding protein
MTEWSFSAAIRAAIRPYLADGYPTLPEMAETFQMSGRTLQRRLSQSGRSYLDVVQEARFDLARELLGDPSTRITEVALATGYGNQQHFARAFRRYAGVSPSVFRKSLSENASDRASGRNAARIPGLAANPARSPPIIAAPASSHRDARRS